MDTDTSEYDGQSLRRLDVAHVAHLGGSDRRRPAGRIRPAETRSRRPAILAGHVCPGVSCLHSFAFTQSSFYPLADWRGPLSRTPAILGASSCLRRPDVLYASEPHTRSPIPARHRTDRVPTCRSRHRGIRPDHQGWDRGAATHSRCPGRVPRRPGLFFLARGCLPGLAGRRRRDERRSAGPGAGRLQASRSCPCGE